MDSLKKYKLSSLDEKRTILSSLLSCYKNLSENNLDFASLDFYEAILLWDARNDESVMEIEYHIDNLNVGEAKKCLYKTLQILINDFSPFSQNK